MLKKTCGKYLRITPIVFTRPPSKIASGSHNRSSIMADTSSAPQTSTSTIAQEQPNMVFYEPSKGCPLPHDPFNAIIGPRPIGWISTKSIDGVLNLAPYSFFNAFNYYPPIIGFSSIGRKDTLTNAEATGKFCWNLATLPLAQQMNQTCAFVDPSVDEFALSGLTPVASKVIDVPRVKESPVSFECKVTQIVQLEGANKEKCDSWMVLGEVVAVHIAEHLLVNGVYDTAAAQPILRGGGPADYFELGQLFKMARPQ